MAKQVRAGPHCGFRSLNSNSAGKCYTVKTSESMFSEVLLKI